MGPIAASFSILAAYVFFIAFRGINIHMARILSICFALQFILAGAYHAVFASYGFVGRLPEPIRSEQLDMLRTYLDVIYNFIFALATCWTLIFLFFVIIKRAVFPIWIVLFTPTLLVLLSSLIKDHIPYPFGAIIYGGWLNLSYIPFFFICLLYFNSKRIKDTYIQT
jgi:hypothetical protein